MSQSAVMLTVMSPAVIEFARLLRPPTVIPLMRRWQGAESSVPFTGAQNSEPASPASSVLVAAAVER